jgi:hypothetical protein
MSDLTLLTAVASLPTIGTSDEVLSGTYLYIMIGECYWTPVLIFANQKPQILMCKFELPPTSTGSF